MQKEKFCTITFSETKQFISVTTTDQEVRIFADSLTYRTVSTDDPALMDKDEFLRFHTFLETSFTLVHQYLIREVVNEMSLLYTWQGADSTFKPILLATHMEIVPQRTIYPGFGHDEEIGGQNGAYEISSLLEKKILHSKE